MKKAGMVNAVTSLLKSELKKAEKEAGDGFCVDEVYTDSKISSNGFTQMFTVELSHSETREVKKVNLFVWLSDRRMSYTV